LRLVIRPAAGLVAQAELAERVEPAGLAVEVVAAGAEEAVLISALLCQETTFRRRQ
jgi:hypothetical protein